MSAAACAAVLIVAAHLDPAQACTVMSKLSPSIVAATPVIVRGEIVAVETAENLDVALTVRVAETLQGTEADSWVVTWSAFSVIVPPHSLAEVAARYGDDIVIGFAPDASAYDGEVLRERIGSGVGSMPRVPCGEPLLGGFEELAPLLREAGVIEQ